MNINVINPDYFIDYVIKRTLSWITGVKTLCMKNTYCHTLKQKMPETH